MEFNKVKDSGVREDMETGSRRDTQKGKSRPDLNNPLVIRRLGMHMANGCDKYGEHNYELGQKTSRYLASLERHLLDFKEGLDDEDHAAAIMWNIHGIIMNQEFVERGIYPPEMDDRTDYRSKEGFDSTVGKWAREFNDKLRAAEDTISDVTYAEACGLVAPAETKPEPKETFTGFCMGEWDSLKCHDCPTQKECWDKFGPFSQEVTNKIVEPVVEAMKLLPRTHEEGDKICGCSLCDALENEPKKSKLICNGHPGKCDAQDQDDDHEGCDVRFICLADFEQCMHSERIFE